MLYALYLTLMMMITMRAKIEKIFITTRREFDDDDDDDDVDDKTMRAKIEDFY